MITKLELFFGKTSTEGLQKKAENFLNEEGVRSILKLGNPKEVVPNYLDLEIIYRSIRLRKPKIVLEFGAGFSTIAIASALKKNYLKDGVNGHLYSVEAEKNWLSNTKKKISKQLKSFITFHYSTVSPHIENNQLFALHDNLPDICPNYIYIDGPNSISVKGKIRGLSFWAKKKTGKLTPKQKKYPYSERAIVAADALLYESTASNDLFIFVDGRWKNSDFLKNNLKNNYKYKRDNINKYSTFERI